MSNPYRTMCVELYAWAKRTSSHYYRTADVLDRTRILLAQPEPPELTDEEIASAAREALDSYRYSTELPYFLEEHASEYEPIMLAFRAAIAADRARRIP
jgi:hypothetical protein